MLCGLLICTVRPLLVVLPCDGHVRQAGAAAAARPRADPQFVFLRSLQKHFIPTHLLQHHDQELEHHNGKVATERWNGQRKRREKREGAGGVREM